VVESLQRLHGATNDNAIVSNKIFSVLTCAVFFPILKAGRLNENVSLHIYLVKILF